MRISEGLAKVSVGGIFMVLVGITLLLNTSGTVGWSIWWIFLTFLLPYLFIQIGISILSKNKAVSNLLNIVALLIFFSLGLARYYWIGGEPDLVQRKVSLADSFTDSKEIKANINLKLGEFTLVDVEREELVYGELNVMETVTPRLTGKVEAERLTVDFDLDQEMNFPFGLPPMMTGKQMYKLELGMLAKPVFLNLDSSFAAGNAVLDEMHIEDISLNNSFGDITLDLRRSAVPHNLRINNSFGQLILILPEERGVQMEYNNSFGNIQLAGENLESFGRGEASIEGKDSVDISVNNSFGNLRVISQ